MLSLALCIKASAKYQSALFSFTYCYSRFTFSDIALGLFFFLYINVYQGGQWHVLFKNEIETQNIACTVHLNMCILNMA